MPQRLFVALSLLFAMTATPLKSQASHETFHDEDYVQPFKEKLQELFPNLSITRGNRVQVDFDKINHHRLSFQADTEAILSELNSWPVEFRSQFRYVRLSDQNLLTGSDHFLDLTIDLNAPREARIKNTRLFLNRLPAFEKKFPVKPIRMDSNNFQEYDPQNLDVLLEHSNILPIYLFKTLVLSNSFYVRLPENPSQPSFSEFGINLIEPIRALTPEDSLQEINHFINKVTPFFRLRHEFRSSKTPLVFIDRSPRSEEDEAWNRWSLDDLNRVERVAESLAVNRTPISKVFRRVELVKDFQHSQINPNTSTLSIGVGQTISWIHSMHLSLAALITNAAQFADTFPRTRLRFILSSKTDIRHPELAGDATQMAFDFLFENQETISERYGNIFFINKYKKVPWVDEGEKSGDLLNIGSMGIDTEKRLEQFKKDLKSVLD